jgi:SH3-like domain-containing protein
MLRSLAIASALLVGLTVPTLAAVATTTGVFVIRVAWPGRPFAVHDCRRNWCAVRYGLTNGWISAHHIDIHR